MREFVEVFPDLQEELKIRGILPGGHQGTELLPCVETKPLTSS